VTLGALLARMDAPAFAGDEGAEVRGLASDSRRVRPGDLFFALTGLRQDGRVFVRQALEAGAVAAVVDRAAPAPSPGVEEALVRVDDPRRALAEAALAFHGEPAAGLRVVGVTGTNGKTTTTYLLEGVFAAAGWRAGVLGTTGARLAGAPWAGAAGAAGYTTPEAPALQGWLRAMADDGVAAVALELSSHALDQRRCYGLDCDVTVFTNLSHDHLDYHGTLETYLDAKLRLFDGRNRPRPAKRAVAVVNADDAAAPAVVAAAARGGQRVSLFGAAPAAAVRIASVTPGPDGLAVELVLGATPLSVQVPLLGRYNAWNAAAAVGAALALGVEPATAARGLAAATGVPGRLERVAADRPFRVVVDYAHTPDALERALAAVREHGAARVLLVFGCGGDRDRAKRPVMGRVARAGADAVWVTSDNPRSEDPAAIAAGVLAGAGGEGGPVRLELDRRAAIAAALAVARPGDTVLVAGKGHETTQTIGEQVLPFDDRAVARELLGARS
jgi:UDP-N-acetylmuramoyl-L-alanyl-D-glutamate--2,6-diaminopimelate ligase